MTTHPPFFSPSARCTAPSPCCTCPRRTSRRPSRKMPPWKPLRVFLGGMRWRREARYPGPKLQLQRRGWGWGGAGTQLAEAARAAGPGKPDYYENRSAAPGLGEMQEAPQAWAPVTLAVNPRSRRLKSESVHYELGFRPQPSDNVVAGTLGKGMCQRAGSSCRLGGLTSCFWQGRLSRAPGPEAAAEGPGCPASHTPAGRKRRESACAEG